MLGADAEAGVDVAWHQQRAGGSGVGGCHQPVVGSLVVGIVPYGGRIGACADRGAGKERVHYLVDVDGVAA